MSRPPNLNVSVFLYVAGTLLVVLAVVLLLQAFNILSFPKEAIVALVLLAVGSGILSAIGRRT